MNIFIFLSLIFIIINTIVFGILFFQIPSLNYKTTGCDTQEGIDKIKNSLTLFYNLMIGIIVILCLLLIFPLFTLVANIFLKITTGFGGSIVKIIISGVELAVILGLLVLIIILITNINGIKENPCQDKTLLLQNMDKIYQFSKIIFIVSIILSVINITGIIVYLVFKYKNRSLERIQYESSEEQIYEPIEQNIETQVVEGTSQ
jgi:hypothetical protein